MVILNNERPSNNSPGSIEVSLQEYTYIMHDVHKFLLLYEIHVPKKNTSNCSDLLV